MDSNLILTKVLTWYWRFCFSSFRCRLGPDCHAGLSDSLRTRHAHSICPCRLLLSRYGNIRTRSMVSILTFNLYTANHRDLQDKDPQWRPFDPVSMETMSHDPEEQQTNQHCQNSAKMLMFLDRSVCVIESCDFMWYTGINLMSKGQKGVTSWSDCKNKISKSLYLWRFFT